MQLKRNKEMEFETLKKNYKKRIIIGTLAICVIGGTLTFNLTRAKYKVTESIDLAKGTINYKPYDFKIMAMYKSEDGTNYTEIPDRMPSSEYVINEAKSYCTIDNKNHDTNAILKTIDGHHVIENLAKSDKCYLYFDKYVPSITMDNIIASTNAKSTTPIFTNAATTDEGVYSVSDGMYGGTSYYWRGAATTNYVKFAGFCWRIVRINGDKTMRLIYDGTTCHANGTNTTESIAVTSAAYNTSYNQSNYVGWTYEGTLQRPSNLTTSIASNAKTQLESWYSSNITGTNASKIAQGRFCNDRNAGSGYTWEISPSTNFSFAASLRNGDSPTLSCPTGDVYNLNVGLITMDETMYAGGRGADNNKYYLYNGEGYWTMSPCCWYYYHAANKGAGMYVVRGSGDLYWVDVKQTWPGLRPVINLKSDVTFSSGDGTLNNPYIVQ